MARAFLEDVAIVPKQLEEMMNRSEKVTWLDAVIAVLLLTILILAVIPFFNKVPLRTFIVSFAMGVDILASFFLITYKKVKWAIIVLLLPALYVAIMFYIGAMNNA